MVEAENISDHSLEEREEEKQEHLGTIRADEPKPNAALTTDEEVEIHQQREEIYKLKKNWKYVLSGDKNSIWQETKITENTKYV